MRKSGDTHRRAAHRGPGRKRGAGAAAPDPADRGGHVAFLRRHHDRAMPRLAALAALGAGAVCASAAITACSDPVIPFTITEERVAVHGVVRAGQRDLAIAVSRIPAITSGQEIWYVGVEDAIVEVSTADGPAVQLEHAPAPEACITGIEASLGGFHGSGCYTATLDATIAPGQRFDLVVRFSDGTRASGAATVPTADRPPRPDSGGACRRVGPRRCRDRAGDPGSRLDRATRRRSPRGHRLLPQRGMRRWDRQHAPPGQLRPHPGRRGGRDEHPLRLRGL